MTKKIMISVSLILSFTAGIGIGKSYLATEDDFVKSDIFKKHILSLKGLEEEYTEGIAKNKALFYSLSDSKQKKENFNKRFNEREQQFNKSWNEFFNKPKSNEKKDNSK
jgi:hypothetical protein